MIDLQYLGGGGLRQAAPLDDGSYLPRQLGLGQWLGGWMTIVSDDPREARRDLQGEWVNRPRTCARIAEKEAIWGWVELEEVFRGTHPGRTSDEQITICGGVGLAFQDAVAAWQAYERGESGRWDLRTDRLAHVATA